MEEANQNIPNALRDLTNIGYERSSYGRRNGGGYGGNGGRSGGHSWGRDKDQNENFADVSWGRPKTESATNGSGWGNGNTKSLWDD